MHTLKAVSIELARAVKKVRYRFKHGRYKNAENDHTREIVSIFAILLYNITIY